MEVYALRPREIRKIIRTLGQGGQVSADISPDKFSRAGDKIVFDAKMLPEIREQNIDSIGVASIPMNMEVQMLGTFYEGAGRTVTMDPINFNKSMGSEVYIKPNYFKLEGVDLVPLHQEIRIVRTLGPVSSPIADADVAGTGTTKQNNVNGIQVFERTGEGIRIVKKPSYVNDTINIKITPKSRLLKINDKIYPETGDYEDGAPSFDYPMVEQEIIIRSLSERPKTPEQICVEKGKQWIDDECLTDKQVCEGRGGYAWYDNECIPESEVPGADTTPPIGTDTTPPIGTDTTPPIGTDTTLPDTDTTLIDQPKPLSVLRQECIDRGDYWDESGDVPICLTVDVPDREVTFGQTTAYLANPIDYTKLSKFEVVGDELTISKRSQDVDSDIPVKFAFDGDAGIKIGDTYFVGTRASSDKEYIIPAGRRSAYFQLMSVENVEGILEGRTFDISTGELGTTPLPITNPISGEDVLENLLATDTRLLSSLPVEQRDLLFQKVAEKGIIFLPKTVDVNCKGKAILDDGSSRLLRVYYYKDPAVTQRPTFQISKLNSTDKWWAVEMRPLKEDGMDYFEVKFYPDNQSQGNPSGRTSDWTAYAPANIPSDNEYYEDYGYMAGGTSGFNIKLADLRKHDIYHKPMPFGSYRLLYQLQGYTDGWEPTGVFVDAICTELDAWTLAASIREGKMAAASAALATARENFELSTPIDLDTVTAIEDNLIKSNQFTQVGNAWEADLISTGKNRKSLSLKSNRSFKVDRGGLKITKVYWNPDNQTLTKFTDDIDLKHTEFDDYYAGETVKLGKEGRKVVVYARVEVV